MSDPENDEERCELYLISPPVIDDPNRFLARLQAAFSGGDVACFQLRLKGGDQPAPRSAVLAACDVLRPAAREAGVAFLINDDPEIASEAGADGVHVGQSDVGCAEARAILGDDAIVGVTCHASMDLAFRAGEAGADYVAFGAFFPTETKQAPTRASAQLLSDWRLATVLPSVAIGGVTPGNCASLVAAGADYLAVSGAVWNDPDGPAAAVAAFHRAIDAAMPARDFPS
ncbi:MAG: thiamine phosphate synthase [Pseudomonadota bacterium]